MTKEQAIAKARKLVTKDHKQRWVHYANGAYEITAEPIPYKRAVSVYWLPIQQCTDYNDREPALAHPAIGAF